MPEVTITLSPEQLARAMANRVTRERGRIAARIEEFAAAIKNIDLDRGVPDIKADLFALAEEIRGVPAAPAAPESAPAPQAEPSTPVEEAELPEHRDHDDFAEGMALVQGGRHRAGVTGRLRAPID